MSDQDQLQDNEGHAKCCPPPAPELAILAERYKALSHPVRLQILQIMAENAHKCCMDIVSNVPLAQSTTSQHLKVLANAGLITLQTKGRTTCAQLNEEGLSQLLGDSQSFLLALANQKQEEDAK
ncbi:transcriptional regulator [Rhodobacteraceae bacterium RKSG542]|uniref:ArsR/SmtB family transcription factor n=1 Tax=Pseudovibrio flavus TaxID=2529854 RepID=UPI0012BD082F|nr:metalloregulator ArsR/SmtB family transcription factor [Pseudovibrio flavus]MTI16724.1 transcriptional regulator [Pseudovibrio flavus]